MDKKELIKILEDNFTTNGYLDLSRLDFTGTKIKSVDISKMKVEGYLKQSHQEVGCNLWQGYQIVKGNLFQCRQEVRCNLDQSVQSVWGDLNQSHQRVGKNLNQAHQIVKIDLDQSDQIFGGSKHD